MIPSMSPQVAAAYLILYMSLVPLLVSTWLLCLFHT